jgi:hypothetical protein
MSTVWTLTVPFTDRKSAVLTASQLLERSGATVTLPAYGQTATGFTIVGDQHGCQRERVHACARDRMS